MIALNLIIKDNPVSSANYQQNQEYFIRMKCKILILRGRLADPCFCS